jgi:hypothetical protein
VDFGSHNIDSTGHSLWVSLAKMLVDASRDAQATKIDGITENIVRFA